MVYAYSSLASYRPYWAHRFGSAPFLPMSRAEMEELGWEACDIIIVSGDAYVDHPSFGMAVIGRVLEGQGFRVGIISQPDWTSPKAFQALGKPTLFFGVTSGNMDSMVNRYTSDRRIRHNDSYTANDEGGRRPDRATIVYAQRCREAYKETPVILGGIEASLRRVAHYDYWSDQVRRSILLDSKADMLVYGNAERAIIEIAHRVARGEALSGMTDIRGTAFLRDAIPDDWTVLDRSVLEDEKEGSSCQRTERGGQKVVVRLPAYESVRSDPPMYAQASRVLHTEANPGNARPLAQRHGTKEVWLNPPPIPLSTSEMDWVFDRPYARSPHLAYKGARIPAWEMIRFSVNIMRGCFGGCSFCSITEHEGRVIQSRSEDSIVREIERIRDKTPGFTGVISDLGGPTANMYRLRCKDESIQAVCRRPSCVYPGICRNLHTDHEPLIALYRRVRTISGVKKILIGSGVRYDLAIRSPTYIRELARHHTGGYLKIAPEHTEAGPLSKMMKPGIGTYERFKTMFMQASKAVGKEQYLIPYFIAAHPGTTDEDMMTLAIWLKRNGFRADQVQAFLPSPMSLSSAMYYSGRNPLAPVRRVGSEQVFSAKGLKQRRLQKAFLRYHDAENWPMLREALKRMGRADLIGNGKRHLVPAWQPSGTGASGGEGKRLGRKHGAQTFMTKHVVLGQRPGNNGVVKRSEPSATSGKKPNPDGPRQSHRGGRNMDRSRKGPK